jgi:pimeloyl-ACP methyl ester carboxylesterase
VGASARFLAVLATIALLVSCSGGTSSSVDAPAPADSTPVTFVTSDGVKLAGRLFGPADAQAGVVLAHMLPADQTSWYPFAERLASDGYRVLTFDFRGYCPGGGGGCSQGHKQIEAADVDLQAAVDRLRQEGVQRVGIAGASMGGTAALRVAATDPRGIPAVVTLSAPQSIEGLTAGPDVLAQIAAAKLYIAGLGDPSGAASSADALAAQSPQPVREEIVTSDAHGTDLLTSQQGEHVAELIEAFFAQWLTGATDASPSL